MNFIEQVKTWDQLIRDGQGIKVRALCRKLNHKKIPRNLIIEYGQIARRVGAPELIVLWLSHIVRFEKSKDQGPTDGERALYALGLLRLGAFREAQQILTTIDPTKDPQVDFYMASLFMNQWNYKKAIPRLKKYVDSKVIVGYPRLVGRLNYCAALVSVEKFSLANIEIRRLMKSLDRENHPLLKGNLLEIQSQYLYNQGLYIEALASLDDAIPILKRADRRSQLYLQKWQILIRAKANPDIERSLSELDTLKSRAQKILDWETLRDCDLHRALLLQDRELVLRVYWGSKFSAYKNRVEKLFGETISNSDEYLWTTSNDRNSPIYDLVAMAPTPILKLLFFALTRELYQPSRTTELLDIIYPNQYYHPVAGPMKMHRLIARARQWLEGQGLPLNIRSYRNSFRLEPTSHCQLRLTRTFQSNSVAELPPLILEKKFFKTEEWSIAQNVSARTARRQIQKLVKQGVIEALHRGPQTKYRVV